MGHSSKKRDATHKPESWERSLISQAVCCPPRREKRGSTWPSSAGQDSEPYILTDRNIVVSLESSGSAAHLSVRRTHADECRKLEEYCATACVNKTSTVQSACFLALRVFDHCKHSQRKGSTMRAYQTPMLTRVGSFRKITKSLGRLNCKDILNYRALWTATPNLGC